MPGPILIPPGAIDQHVTLMALTPALLAGGAAIATSVLDGRAARWCGWFGLVVAVGVAALFLRPHGAAAAYPQPVGFDLVRIGWVPDLLAVAIAIWALARWRPTLLRPRAWSWCARVSLALALPVVQVPLLVFACERDVTVHAARRRWLRTAVLCMATAAVPLIGPRIAMGGALAVVALILDGPWRPALILCALAELAPP